MGIETYLWCALKGWNEETSPRGTYQSQSYISVRASVSGQLCQAASLKMFWNLHTHMAIKISSITWQDIVYTSDLRGFQTASWDCCKEIQVETDVTAAHTGVRSGWRPRVQITNYLGPLFMVQHNTPGHSESSKREGWGRTPKLSLLKLCVPLRGHPGRWSDIELPLLLPLCTCGVQLL